MKNLPLREMSIAEIYNGERATYEVPIYQRNYAWEKDEITALVQDVHDAFESQKPIYYIGTLVSYHKGDQIYEVIDGQQRLTTINLVLKAMDISVSNKLSYRARKKSNDCIASIPDFDVEEKDNGIINGYRYALGAIKEIVSTEKKENYKKYFQNNVHLIHYEVPRDIDLNHYFEIMNSRGEQLEKHEIIKARLIEKLANDDDKAKFHLLWENCSDLSVYIQQKYMNENVFGRNHKDFIVNNFDELPFVESQKGSKKISDLLKVSSSSAGKIEQEKADSFQPIIDFSNFLLIVLKITRMQEDQFDPVKFNLDDKDLIKEFDQVEKLKLFDEKFSKTFAFNLLKAKYFLDNYIVHHSDEEDSIDDIPWKLQYWHKEAGKSAYLMNLFGKTDEQNKLVQLLSMFEVSFTARQRKNYLFYCLLYLFNAQNLEARHYLNFVSKLADKYFRDVYLMKDNLNEINTPKPGSFDNSVLKKDLYTGKWILNDSIENEEFHFVELYGDGSTRSKGIPLFVFNYLDYKLWELYSDELRGDKTKEGSPERNDFFKKLGCSDFGLKIFDQFYFSRTRRSLEHYYPQAQATGIEDRPNQEQINCLGNYAMIGSEINSSGSDWPPIVKREHYLVEGKVRQVSVASLKFVIMMQKCMDNPHSREKYSEWLFDDIKEHQEKMLQILNT